MKNVPRPPMGNSLWQSKPRFHKNMKGRRFWFKLVAALVLAAAAIVDWTRPPEKQASVYLYELAVAGPYQWLLQPVSSRFVRCRYVPSCSVYSVAAVRTNGLPTGGWLTVKRLLRCMPWVPMNTSDPIPPANGRQKAGA